MKSTFWLRELTYSKGQPVMTSARCAHWVNDNLLPNSHLPPGFPSNITPRTASKWLHDLGFYPTPYCKGVYVDQKDVVENRQMYLKKTEILELTHLPSPPCANADLEESIVNPGAQRKFYRDESSFHAYEAEEGKLAIRSKSIRHGYNV